MSEELDPEVVEDIRKREASQRDTTRTGCNYEWTKPKFVGKWKCRTPPCTNFVDVTEDTMEKWAMCNSWLRARNEQPLDTKNVVRCSSCEKLYRDRRAQLLLERVESMAGLIRQLKESRNPRGETEIVKQLREWHHPNVDGLLDALSGESTARRKEKRL